MVSHRHHSHLSCTYPFNTLGNRDAEAAAIVDRSLHRWLEVGMSDWSEWCLPWAAIIQAREGFGGDGPYQLLNMWRWNFVNEGLASVYIPRHRGFTLHGFRWLTGSLEQCEIMQLDGMMGFATATHEMLVHVHGGRICVFPAVPEVWKDVSFQDIRLPGGILASGEMVDGVVRRITLHSQYDALVQLHIHGCRSMKCSMYDQVLDFSLPCEIQLLAGLTMEVIPAT